MIRFAYPNVSYSGEELIGCGRYLVLPAAQPLPDKYRYMEGPPDVSNASALVKAARELSPAPYDPRVVIFEKEDDHDPEEDYRGDSCGFAYLMALINRSCPLKPCGLDDFSIWLTGAVRFDDRPRLDAVIPGPFDVKLKGFVYSPPEERLFIVPSANILQNHEALCKKENIRILDLEDCRRPTPLDLMRERAVIKVDLDQLPLLVEILFRTTGERPCAAAAGGSGMSPGGSSSPAAFELQHTGPEKPGRRGARPYIAALLSVASMAVLLLGGIYLKRAGIDSSRNSEAARRGFALLHSGRLSQADEAFRSIEGRGLVYYLGMSALYLSRGEAEEAEEVLSHIEANQADSPSVLVMKAHLALSKGNLEVAEATYRRALSTGPLDDWQLGECHLGLGRIHLRKGAPGLAIEELDRAVGFDPSLMQGYVSKGLALESMGKIAEALVELGRAAAINPDDPVNAVLYRRCNERILERRASERNDRNERIDGLISDLVKAYNQGPRRPADSRDEWGSRPLFLLFMEPEVRGWSAPREGEDVLVLEELVAGMMSSARGRPVERARLDRLLEELKLSRSELSDPETSLRLGRIFAARIVAAVTLARSRGELRVTVRTIDTETTLITAIASGACRVSDDPRKMIQDLARDLQEKIVAAYPIRGRIIDVNGHDERHGREVVLDVGESVGVTPGMRLRVVEDGVDRPDLVVKRVEKKTCTAVQAVREDSEVPPEKSWRVEEIL